MDQDGPPRLLHLERARERLKLTDPHKQHSLGCITKGDADDGAEMSAGTVDLITQECSPAFSGGLKFTFKLNGAAVSVISTPDDVEMVIVYLAINATLI